MSDGLFAALVIGGLIGLIAIVATVAFLVHEIRRAPLIEEQIGDDLPVPLDVDRIDELVEVWAAQQRKEGR